jgi:phosphoribosyl-AMP cyclohydrolase
LDEKKTVVVALSTTEVEYMATTHASKEAVWLQRLCSGIGLVQQVVRIDCDSQSAIFLVKNRLIIQRQSILMFNITL